MERDKNLYMFVYRMLLTSIYNGTYKYHEKLPSLSQLCEEYSVGRNTLRSALLQLQEDGYLTMHKGVQATVIFDVRDLDNNLKYRQHLMNTRQMTKNVYETLTLILPDLSMACFERGRDKLDELDAIVNRFHPNYIHSETELVSDMYKMYLYIFRYMNNPILIDLFYTLMSAAYQPVTPEEQSAEDLRHSVNQIRKGAKVLLRCIRMKQYKLSKGMVALMVKGHSKHSMDYMDKLCAGLKSEEDTRFIWVCNRGHEYLYAQQVLNIISDIAEGNYNRGDILPSIAELSEMYDVSDRTTRKTLQILREYRVIETINGLGSKVIIDNLIHRQELLKNEDVLRNLDAYKDTLEVFMIIMKVVLADYSKQLKSEELQDIAHEMEKQKLKTLAPLAKELFKKTNRCLNTIYEEIEKTLNWCVLANMFATHDTYASNDLRNQLVDALKGHNHKTICMCCEQILNKDMELITSLLPSHKKTAI